MHSKANNYLLSVINDLFDNYSIDGLLLDYIRYQDEYVRRKAGKAAVTAGA